MRLKGFISFPFSFFFQIYEEFHNCFKMGFIIICERGNVFDTTVEFALVYHAAFEQSDV